MHASKPFCGSHVFARAALALAACTAVACGPRFPGHGKPRPGKPDAAAPDAAAADAGIVPPEDAASDAGPVLGVVPRAYAALTAGDISLLPQLMADLDAAVTQNPEDGRAHFFAGTMRLWKLGEDADDLSVAEMAPFAVPMIERLGKAHELLPGDPRVPAFRGLGEVRVGLLLGNEGLVAQGRTHLEEAIERLPAYGYFLRVSALNGAPAGSANYATVVSDMLSVVEHCAYETDASGRYEYLEGPLDAQRRVCNNAGIVPHVWEGLFITFGDVVLKAGWEPERARVIYESAKSSPTYEEWPFTAELEQRIEQAELRAALYADADASNDPPVWTDDGHVCVGCHQRSP
jgi:hypothetical protein